MKQKTLYKFLRTGMKSEQGNHKWEIGKWYKHKGVFDICKSGFHAFRTPLHALGYIAGEIVAEVEVRGDSIIQDDRECWSEMRIVKAWEWPREDSISLAIFAAEKFLPIYEKRYPKDGRPGKAIEAARKVLESNTEENRKAAERAAEVAWEADASWAADAAMAAESAGAAGAGTWAAAAAQEAWVAWATEVARTAKAAEASAWALRWAAEAVEAAEVAAWVQKKDFTALLDKWFLERITTLEEIK